MIRASAAPELVDPPASNRLLLKLPSSFLLLWRLLLGVHHVNQGLPNLRHAARQQRCAGTQGSSGGAGGRRRRASATLRPAAEVVLVP
jgi:hypothetical protein